MDELNNSALFHPLGVVNLGNVPLESFKSDEAPLFEAIPEEGSFVEEGSVDHAEHVRQRRPSIRYKEENIVVMSPSTINGDFFPNGIPEEYHMRSAAEGTAYKSNSKASSTDVDTLDRYLVQSLSTEESCSRASPAFVESDNETGMIHDSVSDLMSQQQSLQNKPEFLRSSSDFLPTRSDLEGLSYSPKLHHLSSDIVHPLGSPSAPSGYAHLSSPHAHLHSSSEIVAHSEVEDSSSSSVAENHLFPHQHHNPYDAVYLDSHQPSLRVSKQEYLHERDEKRKIHQLTQQIDQEVFGSLDRLDENIQGIQERYHWVDIEMGSYHAWSSHSMGQAGTATVSAHASKGVLWEKRFLQVQKVGSLLTIGQGNFVEAEFSIGGFHASSLSSAQAFGRKHAVGLYDHNGRLMLILDTELETQRKYWIHTLNEIGGLMDLSHLH